MVSFHIPLGINLIWSRMKRRSRLTLKRFGEYSANTEGCSGSIFVTSPSNNLTLRLLNLQVVASLFEMPDTNSTSLSTTEC